jgi:tRNA threonylcarbamoyladenosine biosynthesis protein TsaB
MKLLAIDTSSEACSLALLNEEKMASLHVIAAKQQAQTTLPLLNQLLQSNRVKLSELNAIILGCGPGSFTGLRIAASITQGLAYANNLPVVLVSSLAALAQAAYERLGWKKLGVAVDASMQEVYWAGYVVNSYGLVEYVYPEQVSHPMNVNFTETDYAGVGNAWEIYQTVIPYSASKIDASCLPMATAILTLGKEKYLKQDVVTPENALPIYLRDNIAIKAKI